MNGITARDRIVSLANGTDVTVKEVATDLYPGKDIENVVGLVIAQDFEKENYVDGLRALGMAAVKKTKNANEVEIEISVRPEFKEQGIEEALMAFAQNIVESQGMKARTEVRENTGLTA